MLDAGGCKSTMRGVALPELEASPFTFSPRVRREVLSAATQEKKLSPATLVRASSGQKPPSRGQKGRTGMDVSIAEWVGLGLGAWTFGIAPPPAQAALRMYPPLGRGWGGDGGGGGDGASSSGVLPKAPGTKRVLILMSDTGGGHRASAEALKSAFQIIYGNKFDVHIVDLWSHHTPYPVNQFPKSYSFLVKHSWLWRLNFQITEPRIIHETLMRGYGTVVFSHFARAFSQFDPDLIVSVHPLLQHVPLRVLARRKAQTGQEQPPFATVVTDLTSCHPTWFHKAVTTCFVPTDEVKELAKAVGLVDAQIKMHGLPIRPSFSQPLPAKGALRKSLGMKPNGRAVLIVGGGEGMGQLEPTATALAKTLGPDSQMVVICGRNLKLAKDLQERKWPFPVYIKGFVSNMSEWMGACDCVVTKAGPGTIAEALIRGVPLLLNGCVPCQEEGNIPYVVENGVGAFNTDPEQIAKIISRWFEPGGKELEEMAARAKRLGRPQASFDIVRDLADLANRHSAQQASAGAQADRRLASARA